MAPPNALLSSSSIKRALVTVGNFLSQAIGSVATGDSSWLHQAFNILSQLELHLPLLGVSAEQMLSMHATSESIKAWMEAIGRSKKLQDTTNHEKSMRTSTSTSIQETVAKSKVMSLHVSTSQKKKVARTSKKAELETELQRLRELETELQRLRTEEAKENSKTETLTHNLKTMVAEVRVLVEKEKTPPPPPPVKEIAFQHAKPVLEEREHKAKLAKLKDILEEIQKTLNP
ncbi:hypothetical protein LINGRAHAP2_LOCUS7673 [Linum grandiflorum]